MKYRIYMTYKEYGYIDVEAETESEAYRKAEEIDTSDVIIDECGYWSADDCEIIKEESI